jgi:adenylosuccinate lyase
MNRLIPKEFVKKLLQAVCHHENSYVWATEENHGHYVVDLVTACEAIFDEEADARFAHLCFHWSNDILDWAKETYKLEIVIDANKYWGVAEQPTIKEQ